MTIDFPKDLLALEEQAWQAQQDGTLITDQALAVHTAVGKFAEQAGLSRLEVEMGLKRAVRHAAAEA